MPVADPAMAVDEDPPLWPWTPPPPPALLLLQCVTRGLGLRAVRAPADGDVIMAVDDGGRARGDGGMAWNDWRRRASTDIDDADDDG